MGGHWFQMPVPTHGACEHAPYSRSWCETVDPAVEESYLPHVAESRDAHEQPSQADAEPTVRRTAVPEETEVVLQRSESVALLLGLLDQLLVVVFTLSTRRDLESLPQKVEALGHAGAGVTHVVERTHLGRIVSHKNELVTVLLGDQTVEQTLSLGVEVRLLRDFVTQLCKPLTCLAQRDPRERSCRHFESCPEDRLKLGAVLFSNDTQDEGEELLLELHHRLVRLHPRELHVHRGKFGVVTGGVRRVGPEDRTNLEDALEATSNRQLLVELRRLGQIGRPTEVREREQLRPGLASCTEKLRRVNLDEPALRPELAHGLLERRLDPQDQLALGRAQTDLTVVHACLERCTRLDWQGLGEVRDFNCRRNDLDAAQFDLRRLDHLTGNDDCGLGSELLDQLSERLTLGLQVRDLSLTGGVADDDELHILVHPHRFHESFDDHVVTNRPGDLPSHDPCGHDIPFSSG